MTDNSAGAQTPSGEWAAESVRVTGFPTADAEVKPDNWWRQVVGEEPEVRTDRPRSGEKQESGSVHGGRLTLKVQPARIDWLLAPVVPETELPDTPPGIGSFEHASHYVSALMRRWFPICPPLARLAFGPIVFLQVPTRADGYRRLSSHLPSVQLDPEGSSDFMYRINRPRPSRSGIKNLRINRLSTWSLVQIEYQALALGSRESGKVFRAEPIIACRVELDINTAPDFDGEITSLQAGPIFDELLSLAVEILRDGDRP